MKPGTIDHHSWVSAIGVDDVKISKQMKIIFKSFYHLTKVIFCGNESQRPIDQLKNLLLLKVK